MIQWLFQLQTARFVDSYQRLLIFFDDEISDMLIGIPIFEIGVVSHHSSNTS